MNYLVIKSEHEIFIQDTFEGPTFEEAIAKAFNERDFVLGNGIEDLKYEGTTVDEFIKWVKDDNYEFNYVYESESEIK